MPANETYDALIERLNALEWKLPNDLLVPPQAVIEFTTRSREPNVNIDELSKIVETEPTLTTELLRSVNSSLYGFRQKIDSVAQALRLLGITNCASILLSKAFHHAVGQIDSPLIPSIDARREALERGRFSKEVALRLGFDPILSYTAATLQDILLPLLTGEYESSYQKYLNSDDHLGIEEFERDEFGWTHADVTAKTLHEWGFPDTLIRRVAYHHAAREEFFVADGPLHEATPNAISSLLRDVMQQSPSGITRLVDLQRFHPKLNVLQIAEVVDSEVSESPQATNQLPLVNRIQFAMLEQIETRRKQSLIPGRQFGSYVLEEKITESTMGAIFKAKHILLRRPAAIKFLRVDKMNAETIQQFEHEVQVTSTLCHPNTISIFDYGHTPDDLFYYAMEFIDGLTLNDVVNQSGPLPDKRVVDILYQISGSLAEAHARGLVHRDIKPQNIIASDSVGCIDRITVLDFGLVTDAKTNSSSLMGTPLYMAPEAARREPVDGRGDIYSLGAMAYFLLTGEPVFTGQTLQEVLTQHVSASPVPPSKRTDNPIHPELETLILDCLRKSPDERPQSALDLMERLNSCPTISPWTPQNCQSWWSQFRSSDAPNETINDNFMETHLEATFVPEAEMQLTMIRR